MSGPFDPPPQGPPQGWPQQQPQYGYPSQPQPQWPQQPHAQPMPGQPMPGQPMPGQYGWPGQPPPGKSTATKTILVVLSIVIGVLVIGGATVAIVAVSRGDNGGTTGSPSAGPRGEAALANVIDYRKTKPDMLTTTHKDGDISYPVDPPAGGPHHIDWQNCDGDVYDQALDNGYAVHSEEHGGVWVTYRPDLPEGDVSKLAQHVRGKAYTMMSPYPGLTDAVSIQTWGYQLKLSTVDLAAVDAFIRRYAKTASIEPGADCGNGRTVTAG